MEKLFENIKEANVEMLVNRINELIGAKFAILDEQDDIQKWNGMPKLLMLDEIAQKRFMSFVEYMDSLLIPIEDKAIMVVSLSGLMEFANIKLYDYDDGSLYTMADFYQNSSIEEIKNTISIVGNKELLNAVRGKTLDLDLRKKMLTDIVNKAKENGNTTKYIEETIKKITE